ncbi:MAG: redoxin domain-containing protein [Proteobacteria bacterium]|nr:redoxin domain-containing protein [Burkholderiales bacterium]
MIDTIRRRWANAALWVGMFAGAGALLIAPDAARAALAQVGAPAPVFTLPSIDGRKVSLADYAGKYVVLEWWNSQCYAINRHYDGGAMQAAQKRARSSEVVWLTVDSTQPGHSSFVDARQTADMLRKWKATPSALLQDPDGRVGRLYGATVTPHTFVIDPKGRLIYAGAIDDQRAMRDVKKARNLAFAALDEARAGTPVSTPLTQGYG